MTHPPAAPRRALPAWLWAACAFGALPIAWAAQRAGFGMPITTPARDLALLALGAVVEEIVFRGGLQRTLGRWRALGHHAGPISAANALTSAVFAAAHLWSHPPLAALGVLPVSLLLGWVYECSGERLVPPVLLHLYFNAVLFAFSLGLHDIGRLW
jgi:hypothetical protein